MSRLFLPAYLSLFLAGSALADHLVLTSGRTFDGQVLQETDSSVTFRLDHGIITVPRQVVASVDKTPPPPLVKPSLTPPPASQPVPTSRIPPWTLVTTALAKQPWATNLKQIPATVVDKGQMRYVPYSSYRCGEDYEVNIYGDPDAPAGVEIGVYHRLLSDPKAKNNCVEFIASLLGNGADWTTTDIRDARPTTSATSAGGDRVYVRGYYRKNGTYVAPYTRSYPHSGGSGHHR